MLERTNRTGVDWHYIVQGKPQQNGFVESFNGKLRDERGGLRQPRRGPRGDRALAARLQPPAPALGPWRPYAGSRAAEPRGRPAAQLDQLHRPAATAGAGDQLPTPRALTMIEGPEGGRSASMTCQPVASTSSCSGLETRNAGRLSHIPAPQRPPTRFSPEAYQRDRSKCIKERVLVPRRHPSR